jgi:hypothetical protein
MNYDPNTDTRTPLDYDASEPPIEVPGPMSWECKCFLIAVGIVIAMLVLWAGRADAHEAPPSKMQPLGWQYGWECCSMTDCRPIGSDAVETTPHGYVVKLTGEIIPYGDPRIKRSKDELFHQCRIGGDPKATHSICLYAPDQGF